MTMSSITNPKYYNGSKISTFDVVDDWKLDFYLGNAVKYIQRRGAKPNNPEVDDLQKAIVYLQKEIELINECKSNAE